MSATTIAINLEAIQEAKKHGYGALQRFDHTKTCHDCDKAFFYLHSKQGELTCPTCTAARISQTNNPSKP